ncbi:diacylglycerol kinase family protein [Virgibacillus sp. MSJ-26]|uniref:diacylglycerol kinase family protein n=1 Tax=Virgibacillus sp. MSJ-26 TaxID=2841522 RepID=UPI00209D1E7A|nr:diacylglycerol kinase family protein [Virgibacillus sp. MSJ-26]
MADRKKGIGLKHAWHGIKVAIKLERNFKIHVVIGLLVIMMSVYFNIATFEWLVILLVIGSVLVAEIFNSTIEKLLDYLNPAIHPAAKIIKDLSAAAVLITAFTAVIIGLIIFIPKLINVFT